MKQFHPTFNGVLRSAMASYLDGPCWSVLGCYWQPPNVSWACLDDVIGAVYSHISEHAEASTVDVTGLTSALSAVGSAVRHGNCHASAADLRGVAFIGNFNVAEKAVCKAQAVFDDGTLYLNSWPAAEAAPRWQIYEPRHAEVIIRSDAMMTALEDLLRAICGTGPKEAR